jgi:hypothetical protein
MTTQRTSSENWSRKYLAQLRDVTLEEQPMTSKRNRLEVSILEFAKEACELIDPDGLVTSRFRR